MKVSIGKGLVLDVDFDQLKPHANVLSHIIAIGLKNILQDCHANMTKEKFPDTFVELSRERAEAKLAELYAGSVRIASRGERVHADPLANESARIARGMVAPYMRWKDEKWTFPSADKLAALRAAYAEDYDFASDDDLERLYDDLVEAQSQAPDVVALAEANLAAKAKKPALALGALRKKEA